MTKLEYKVLFKYLQEYNLPKIPMMINDPLSENFKFDWIKSVVRIKKSYGVDKFIGYDIFNDPKNRSVKFGALGSPTQENDLPM